jgi:hypothetical protein
MKVLCQNDERNRSVQKGDPLNNMGKTIHMENFIVNNHPYNTTLFMVRSDFSIRKARVWYDVGNTFLARW